MSMILAWIINLQDPHGLPLFRNNTSSILSTLHVIKLNFIVTILPLSMPIAIDVVESQCSLVWYHLLSIFVVHPSITPGHLVHLNGHGLSAILTQVLGLNFEEHFIRVFVLWLINRELNSKLLPDIFELDEL